VSRRGSEYAGTQTDVGVFIEDDGYVWGATHLVLIGLGGIEVSIQLKS